MHSHTRSTIHGMRIFIAFLLGTALLSSWPGSGKAAQLPTLPLVFINTTYAKPAGTTVTVNSGGNLQAAINSAIPGTTIVVQAGATFAGPISLPNKTGTGWIYIQSSAYSSLPAPGTRVGPTDASNMATITVTTSAGDAAIKTRGKRASLSVCGNTGQADRKQFHHCLDYDRFRGHEPGYPAQQHYIRSLLHPWRSDGGRSARGSDERRRSVAIIDSYLSDFKENGNDTQALWTYNSPGPLKIVNNYLEASGENFMTGGADPAIANLVPSDIEIRRNHFFKPLSWIGMQWTVKNLLEFQELAESASRGEHPGERLARCAGWGWGCNHSSQPGWRSLVVSCSGHYSPTQQDNQRRHRVQFVWSRQSQRKSGYPPRIV